MVFFKHIVPLYGVDAIIFQSKGPNTLGFLLIIRGLVSDWHYPLFVHLDFTKLTVEWYEQLVQMLHAMKFRLMVSVCDGGSSNESLASPNKLDITPQKPYTFVKCQDEEKKVFFSFDYVHAFKLTRNHLLDKEVKLPCGTIVTVNDLQDVVNAISKSTFPTHLTQKHLTVCKSDRQIVGWANAVMSHKTAALLRQLFPNCPRKLALANFLTAMHDCFKVLTSKAKPSNDPLKQPFGTNKALQLQALKKAQFYYENTTFKVLCISCPKLPLILLAPLQLLTSLTSLKLLASLILLCLFPSLCSLH